LLLLFEHPLSAHKHTAVTKRLQMKCSELRNIHAHGESPTWANSVHLRTATATDHTLRSSCKASSSLAALDKTPSICHISIYWINNLVFTMLCTSVLKITERI
jgi:Zn-dependent oligopeptidase